MAIIKILFITVFCFLFSCKAKNQDQSLKIYHLEPNDIQINTDTLRSYGWYSKQREDFFAIKNFDITNEQHKIKIDSFVLTYLKKDNFLIKNKNVKWSLTFFKYGNKITENTKHEYNTDYTIHNLFAQNKEICYFTFDTRVGYRESSYWVDHKKMKTNDQKRELILNYFENHIKLNNPN